MAYLTFTGTEEKQNTCFKFIGMNNTNSHSVNLISDNTSLITSCLALEAGEDTCSFYSGPSDSTILAFAESYESCGSIAYDSTSSFGGYSSCESCGSIASSSASSSSCGMSSYSC